VDDLVVQSQQAVSQRVAPQPSVPVAPSRSAGEGLTELDRLLDKISQQGIDSLTGDERRLLEERSRELRKDD
jgi:hypothetical protein